MIGCRGHASMCTGKRLLGGGGWRWVEARSGRVFSHQISDPRRGKLGIFGSRGGRPWILNTSSGRGYVETQPRQPHTRHGDLGWVSVRCRDLACVFAVSSRQSSPGARSVNIGLTVSTLSTLTSPGADGVNMLPIVIITLLTTGAQACNILGGSLITTTELQS